MRYSSGRSRRTAWRRETEADESTCVLEGLLVREGQRRDRRGDGRAGPGPRVPPGASPVPEVVIRRGDRSRLDAGLISGHVALRRAERPGLLAQRRRRARRAGRRGRRAGGEEAASERAMAAP